MNGHDEEPADPSGAPTPPRSDADRGDDDRRDAVAALEEANNHFYECFEARDLDAMGTLWRHDDDVFCVHPGSEVIVGWRRVRLSWAVIFTASDYLQFIVTDVRASVRGTAGTVTCTENILASGTRDGDLGAGKAVATNVFSWSAGDRRWRLVAHHASPVLRRI